MEERQLHYNIPQLRSAIVDAPEEWGVMGRGTGKTEGILAVKTVRRILEMPRSTRVLLGATFQQILTRTLPPLVAGWEKQGYRLGFHYHIGIKPPLRWRKQWGWKGPYRPPFKYDYVISWFNGAVMQMISQDRIGSSNGMSIDGIDGDEAKLLNRDRLMSETMPANRGIIHAFKDNPHHHGLTFTTDMPVGTSGRWILDKADEVNNEKVQKVMQLETLRMLLLQSGGSAKKLLQVQQALTLLRRGMVYYHTASTLDNLHGVGIDYIRQMMRNLSDFEFETSILNRQPRKLEDGFYPDLDEEKHGYFAYSYSQFKKTGYDFKKLEEADGAAVDGDYNPNMPLHLGMDCNRRITPLVVAQVHKDEIRVINGIHTTYPLKQDDTMDAFCKYYANHKKKVIYFWYDHTLIAEHSNSGAQADDAMKYLRAKGWVVIPRYTGQASGHDRRYTMYAHLLKEDGTYPYVLRMNRDRGKYLLLSMYQAQAVRTKRGFGKDKKPELDPKFPAEEATHFSEALDMLIFGILESGMSWVNHTEQVDSIAFI